jgi:NAD(P)-dependent dehydrogenase (short-subunit alcohol dehydrogenase family)
MTLKLGPHTTAAEVLEGIDLAGKRALITGGSGGLGAATARALADKGAEVIVTARDLEKARKASLALRDARRITVEQLELSAFANIRAFAQRIRNERGSIDLLILNAGVMACPHAVSEDGFELQFGTNHLGHFLLTSLLAPRLTRGARVIVLSSAAHHASPVIFDDLQFEQRPYDKWQAYGQSKTANALFAVGLQARGIEAFSVHPGMIMTDLMRHQGEEGAALARALRDSGKMAFKTIDSGIATTVYAATAHELQGQGGAYLCDCGKARVSEQDKDFSVVRPYAIDPVLADTLWTRSEALIGASFAP